MNYLIKILLLLLVSALLIGCVDSDTEFEGTDEDPVPPSFQGTFSTGCLSRTYTDDEGVVQIYYENRTLTFSGYNYTIKRESRNASCTETYATREGGGTFQMKHRVITTSGLEAYRIQSTLSTYTLTPVTDAIASSWNEVSYCGYTDWAVNTPKDVLGCSVEGDKSAGDTYEDGPFYLLDDTLYYQDDNDYDEVDLTRPYSRQ